MRWPRARVLAVALGVAVSAVAGVGGHSAVAATRAGQVVIVSSTNLLDPIDSGSHATSFSLRLPPDSTCPGDSMNDDWRLQTFVVPSSDDPGELTYYVTGPAGPEDDARVSLYTTEGRPFVDELLGANARPGLPGEIPQFPPLSFKRLPVDYLPTGSYLLGVACTDRDGRTQKYWDTTIELTASAASMEWRVVSEQPGSLGRGSRTGLVVLFTVLGVVLLLVAIVIWRRPGSSRSDAE